MSGNKRYKALSLPGGGCRGIIQAALLSRVDLSGLDAVAGTSAGSGTAAAIASGVQGRVLERMFEENARDIFRYHFFRRLNPFSVPYSGKNLLKALKKTLDIPMKDLGLPCYIPATGFHGRAKVFDRSDSWTAAEVCRASMSSPHLFPPFEKDGVHWMDGGLWANDPIVVLAGAIMDKMGVSPGCLDIMTVRNGHKERSDKEKKIPGTLIGWLYYLIPYITAGNETAARYTAERMPLGGLTTHEGPEIQPGWDLDKTDRMGEMKEEALKGLDDFKRRWDVFMSRKN